MNSFLLKIFLLCNPEKCLQMYQFHRCPEHKKQNCDVHHVESFATPGEIWRHDWRSTGAILQTDSTHFESI